MPTEMRLPQGNPYCLRDLWYFTDERGREHGPYLSLGRATIGLGKYIRDEVERDAPRLHVLLIITLALVVAGYFVTHS